jgi:hypothetical protein
MRNDAYGRSWNSTVGAKIKNRTPFWRLLSGNRHCLTPEDDNDSPPLFPEKSAQKVVVDFLTGVWGAVRSELITKFGESLLRSKKSEVVITVPATWSDRAKDLISQV